MTRFESSSPESTTSTPLQAASFAVEQRGSAAVLTVSGEIDMVTAPKLQEQLTKAVADEVSALVVDLSGVSFFASAGLSALVNGYTLANERGAELRVVATSSATIRPLQITALDRKIAVFDSLENALQGGQS